MYSPTTNSKVSSQQVPGDQPARAAFSIAETAQMLGLCEASIYRAMRRGDIASVLVGGRRIIPASTIDGLLKPQPNAARAA